MSPQNIKHESGTGQAEYHCSTWCMNLAQERQTNEINRDGSTLGEVDFNLRCFSFVDVGTVIDVVDMIDVVVEVAVVVVVI